MTKEAPFQFKTKQELLDSFAIYSMQAGDLDKESAQEYAKMMCSYRPEIGWLIRDYGYAKATCACFGVPWNVDGACPDHGDQ